MVSTLGFGRLEDGVSPGFDVDGAVSEKDDGTGCGKADVVGVDGTPGVDNAFATLLPVLEATEAAALEPLVQDFITNGTILLVLEMAGWADADPECGTWQVLPGAGEPLIGTDGFLLPGQTLDVDLGAAGDQVPAFVDGDALVAHGFSFDLDIQIFDAVIQLPVRGASVRIERTDDSGHFVATMGGGFVVDAILDSLLGTGIGDEVEELLPTVLNGAADLDLDGDGTCEAMSVALEIDAVSVWLYDEEP